MLTSGNVFFMEVRAKVNHTGAGHRVCKHNQACSRATQCAAPPPGVYEWNQSGILIPWRVLQGSHDMPEVTVGGSTGT